MSSRDSENNLRNTRSCWWSTKRQYRSVAFGTWKVAGNRVLSLRRGVSEGEGQLIRLVQFDFSLN